MEAVSQLMAGGFALVTFARRVSSIGVIDCAMVDICLRAVERKFRARGNMWMIGESEC